MTVDRLPHGRLRPDTSAPSADAPDNDILCQALGGAST